MANSEFEYVRKHEQWDALAPDHWIVVRIDGRGFSKFSKKHNFTKPNDRRAIDLMNSAAIQVIKAHTDIILAYGQSDEYSFILHEQTTLFDRRASKIATTIAATFSVEYALQWGDFFPGEEQVLTRPFPTFDGRCVLYPKIRLLRDYLSWRQADCHINNLYNTTFWNMVLKGGMTGTEAELALKGTISSDKNEILFSQFGINYNNEAEIWKKGTVIYRVQEQGTKAQSKTQAEKERKKRQKARIAVEHVDIIRDGFWEKRPWILAGRGFKVPVE
ncbi:Thg1 C terminal domain-containing protein [Delphinella strobiligena]|nr:Thg1 C terminal domain-containing protein [Delphinella strobiligena]